jgi:hypothetical protein
MYNLHLDSTDRGLYVDLSANFVTPYTHTASDAEYARKLHAMEVQQQMGMY